MEVVRKITCISLLIIGSVYSSVLPVEKCSLADKACMLSAVQKMIPIFIGGMPEYDVEVLDPMSMYDIKFDLSGLQFSLSGATLKGMKNVNINEVQWDEKKKVFVIGFNGDIIVRGHYTAAGRVLILPITGDGQIKMKMKNIYITLYIHYEMDNGHVKPTKYTFKFDVKDNAHFHLTNLFNGNKELSDAMLLFLNENWKQISMEFGQPVVDTAAKQIFKNIGNFFAKIPIADIANV